MDKVGAEAAWARYRDAELASLQPHLAALGISLDGEQVHLGGERYLTAGRKLVLVGERSSDRLRVVVKASSDASGAAEIERELAYRRALEKLNFAYHVFQSPPVVLDVRRGGFRILVTEFIEQATPFLQRPLGEQFFIALKAFEGLESIHATTYGHLHDVERTLGLWSASTYRGELASHRRELGEAGPSSDLGRCLTRAIEHLDRDVDVVNRYANFLAHWDLVPHNFRVRGHGLYLLDHSALRFGNRYESWARFINFMALYSPALERALVAYVAENRGPGHSQALKVMRLYRLAELAMYYHRTLPAAEGNVKVLNQMRVELWLKVFEAVESGGSVGEAALAAYRSERDALRDQGERARQVNLH